MASVLQKDLCKGLGSRTAGAYAEKQALQPWVGANGNTDSAVQKFLGLIFLKSNTHEEETNHFFF